MSERFALVSLILGASTVVLVIILMFGSTYPVMESGLNAFNNSAFVSDTDRNILNELPVLIVVMIIITLIGGIIIVMKGVGSLL